MRTVRFPGNEEFGVGGLGLLSVRSAESESDRDWEFLAYARGEVLVPDDRDLRLSIRISRKIATRTRSESDTQAKDAIIRSYLDEVYAALEKLHDDDIQSLIVHDPIDNYDLMRIGCLAGLREIIFACYRSVIADSGVKHLERLVNLEHLKLANSHITDVALSSIGKMKSLKRLGLSNTGITGEGFTEIAGLNVTELMPGGAPLTINGYINLSKISSLQKLYLTKTVSDAALEEIGKCSSLQELTVSKAPITDDGIRHLRNLAHLKYLSLSGTSITDNGVKHLRTLKELQSISLYETQITDTSATYLAELRCLTSVNLSHTTVTAKAVAELSRLPHLKRLTINSANVNDAAGPHLAKMDRLEELWVKPYDYRPMPCGPVDLSKYNSNNAVTDEGYACLKTMFSLRELHLQDTPITDKTLEYLKNHPGIEELNLANTATTDKGIESIATCQRLKNLSLWNTNITDAGMASLAKLHTLQTLIINGTGVTGKGIAHMSGLVKLEVLRAFGIELGNDTLAIIGNMPHLREIHITWGDFSSAGLSALAKNRSLRVIYISDPPDIIDTVWDLQEAMPWCLVLPLPTY